MTASQAWHGAGPPLPQFWEFAAPPGWLSIDFISDLHLQASQPRTTQALAAHLLHTSADAVFILGDLFETWVGDDARHDAFEASIADMLKDASARRSLAFMAGNRDFLLGGSFLQECGVMALPDPTVLVAFGKRLLLTHGDALCLGDTAYQRFRGEVRTEQWRRSFLKRPLTERRALAARMREGSAEHQRAQPAQSGADVDPAAAVQWMHEAATRLLVHGHTHRPATEEIAPGFTRLVLTDWELDRTPARCGVLRLSERGLERVAPAGPAPAA
ncbi:MAG: UDP-2,3-diacylglucosamine diphosphatase [Methylibium sp.]|nr:UDP-2,3-diacylglucosamine diphosphatase [Methylibium sp.]